MTPDLPKSTSAISLSKKILFENKRRKKIDGQIKARTPTVRSDVDLLL